MGAGEDAEQKAAGGATMSFWIGVACGVAFATALSVIAVMNVKPRLPW
jgi:hypothetical protein